MGREKERIEKMENLNILKCSRKHSILLLYNKNFIEYLLSFKILDLIRLGCFLRKSMQFI